MRQLAAHARARARGHSPEAPGRTPWAHRGCGPRRRGRGSVASQPRAAQSACGSPLAGHGRQATTTTTTKPTTKVPATRLRSGARGRARRPGACAGSQTRTTRRGRALGAGPCAPGRRGPSSLWTTADREREERVERGRYEGSSGSVSAGARLDPPGAPGDSLRRRQPSRPQLAPTDTIPVTRPSPSTPTSAASLSNMIGEGASWQHSLDVGVRLGLSVADASAAFPPGALAGWLFLLGVLLAAVLLFTMVFFVRLCLRTFAIGQRLTSSSHLHRRRSSCSLVRHSRGRAATGSAADEVALSPDALPRSLADLECDYVNPIDLSNKLNQVRPASRSWDSRSPHSPERAEPDTGATS
jgi:hypothetical protein